MFMRFVELRIQPDRLEEFEQFYERRVGPALRDTEGCIFACLLSNPKHPAECVSMTLWSSPKAADRYESGGMYQSLVDEAEPYLWRSAEWRIRLSDDLRLEYEQVDDPPAVEAFPVEVDSAADKNIESVSANQYLRIVSGRVRPGKMDALVERYQQVIVPALLSTDGCRHAYLVRGFGGSDEVLSVTLWDSQAHAEDYERRGRFRELLREVEPMLSSVLQWKMILNPSLKQKEASSEDMHIEGYQVVASESFSD